MTKNRLLYSAIIVAAIIFVFFDEGRTSYTFLYAVLMMPVISWLMSKLSLHNLSVMQAIDKNLIVKGEETKYHIIAVNKVFFISPVFSFVFSKSHNAIQSEAENIMLALPAQSERDISFNLTCGYRGVYYVGLESVQALDYLGLFSLSRSWEDKTQLVVYPRVVEIAHFPLSMSLLSKNFSRLEIREEDYSAISDIRPYLPSDNIKRIHWKLSAKKNSLIVKNFENTALNSMTVVLDRMQVIGDEQYSIIAEDKIVEIVVSLCHYCLRKMIPVDFFYGEEPVTAVSLTEFNNIYTCAAHVNFTSDVKLDSSLGMLLSTQSGKINLVVVTSHMTGILMDELSSAYYFGHYVILVYIPPQQESDEAVEMVNFLKEIGMHVYRININDNILDHF